MLSAFHDVDKELNIFILWNTNNIQVYVTNELSQN